MQAKTFRIGDWQVDRAACTLLRDGEQGRLIIEPRAMDVLSALCTHSGEILSADDLLRLCWDGLTVGENQVHKAIAQLRRTFGDDANEPRYIENIRKRGYRTVAAVSWPQQEADRAAAGSWRDGSPYVGLDPFDAAHAQLFFGREAAVSRLAQTAAAQIERRRALVLVLGPSGSGKTSLIQAGLLPALREAGRLIDVTTLDLGDIGQTSPAAAVGGALLDWEIDGQPALAGHSAEEIGGGLAIGADFGLGAVARPNGKFALVVDRLEALFSLEEGAKTQFLAALDQLARNAACLVIAACRNDFYPDIAQESVLMEGKPHGAHFDLGPPSRGEIAQMIRLPAQAAGLTFGLDPDSLDSLADLLGEAAAQSPDALPLLQYTLQELYFQRSSTRELTLAAYRSLGGLEGAIGKRAEAALTALPEAAQSALPRILPQIVQIDADDGLVRSRRAAWSALQNFEDRALVRALVDQRLFVSLSHDGAALFGVAHEALLRQWPRVVDWVAEHRQALRTRGRLEGSAQQWIAEGRRRDLLLPRGKPVEEARALAADPAIHLRPDVADFIAASARRVRLSDRRRLGAATAFALVALGAAGLGLFAQREEVIAERRTRQSEDLMSYMVGDLADKLRPLGRLDLLSGVGEKALSYFGDAKADKLTSTERRNQAKALQTLAEVARAHADPKAAQDALILARSLLDHELAQEPDNIDLLKNLGANSFWLGQIALDQKRLDDAAVAFEDYRHFAERMIAVEPENVDSWIELSYAYTNLGSVAKEKKDHARARSAFEKSIDLKRKALEHHPDDRALRAGLANSLSWLGSEYAAGGSLQQALDLYNQNQTELAALRNAAPTESSWTYRLAAAKDRRANLLADLGQNDAAIDEIHAAKNLAQALVQQDPANRIWLRTLINCELVEGRILTALGELQEALDLQLAAASKFAALAAQDPSNKELRTIKGTNLTHLGNTLLRLGRPNEARQQLEAAVDTISSLSPGSNADTDQRLALALILLNYARRSAGEATDENCRKAAEILHPLLESNPTDADAQDLGVRTDVCLGRRDDVKEKTAWLAQIGYRNSDYLYYLSKQPK